MKHKTGTSEAQRRLIEAYEAIRDSVPDPPKGGWGAWIQLGRETEMDTISNT